MPAERLTEVDATDRAWGLMPPSDYARVLEATGVEFDWDVQQAGTDVMAEHGGPFEFHAEDFRRRC